jgi:predicted transcriptional regulator
MLTQKQAVEVRVLASRGAKVKQIARELGISKNTVKRYLRIRRRATSRVRHGQIQLVRDLMGRWFRSG